MINTKEAQTECQEATQQQGQVDILEKMCPMKHILFNR
jgi:hypothetical protein